MSAGFTTIEVKKTNTGELTRYSALLKISDAVGSHPSVDAVIHTFADVLSNAVSFESIALLLFDTRHNLVFRALERGMHDPGIEIGEEIPYAGTGLARAIEEQAPVFIPDIRLEIAIRD